MAILFMSKAPGNTETYVPLLKQLLPDQDLRIWPDAMGNVEDIEYAIIGVPESGVLGTLPNLKAVLSLWAGVDSLLADPVFPRDVPLARMVDPLLAVDMTHFAVHWVLHFHRGLHRYASHQRQGIWNQLAYPEAAERRVGIMGLGVLGTDAATTIAGLGFSVAGWDAADKSLSGVETFAGSQNLRPFLETTEILIVLLPLTADTRGIINSETLSLLPEGAFLISLARGAHIVDADLIAALDNGRLAGAVLDAFTEEPLPADHVFWRHPKIVVTPHVASKTTPRTAATEIAIDIGRLMDGKMPRHMVDVERGY